MVTLPALSTLRKRICCMGEPLEVPRHLISVAFSAWTTLPAGATYVVCSIAAVGCTPVTKRQVKEILQLVRD